ncbi:thioesterase family protein [Saccharobesus litoralis]|uniref:Thioesterase family protein n=1 Tax=Saccharobesus litoralis TaxID=2172099 RepID=A0A2S0VUL2_9ALTE|nr:thioesterase family protein [Saccharobesus litoralis]AWB67916.1 thioesterase family protein [Saccharobesus litoralis]
MHIDTLFEQVVNDPSTIIVPNNWTQGRTVFGGLSASLLLKAMFQKIKDETRQLRTINIHFTAPLLAEQSFSIVDTLLAQGKNTTSMRCEIIQGDRVCVSCIATFGKTKASKLTMKSELDLKKAPPEKGKFIPQIPMVTPKFLRHVDLAIDEGGLPFLGGSQSHYKGWMRFKQKPEQITTCHVLALIDAWPPAVLQMFKGPIPASTMTWNIEFTHSDLTDLPLDWLNYQVETLQADEGYAHTEAKICATNGELIALSRQCVAIFG